MKRKKPVKYTVQLPATPCTSEMREQVLAIADNRNEGLAAIQREAIAFFLAENAKKVTKEMN